MDEMSDARQTWGNSNNDYNSRLLQNIKVILINHSCSAITTIEVKVLDKNVFPITCSRDTPLSMFWCNY